MLNKKTKISSLLLGTAFIGSAILAGCGSPTTTGGTGSGNNHPGQNNPDAVYRELGGWTVPPQYQGNIFGAGGIGSAYGFTQIGLFQFVRSTDKVFNTMAASVDNSDPTKTVVKIKPGKWSDGQPVTSQDVKAFYTLNDGVQLDKFLTKIDTPDPQTVVFYWTNPAPFDEMKQLALANDWAFQIPYHVYKKYVDQAQAILDAAPVDTNPADLGKYPFEKKLTTAQQTAWNNNWNAFTKDDPKLPIGAGPYTVQKVTQNQMVLVKNPNYFDASKVKFKKIVLSQVNDLNQQYALLKGGQLDRYDGTQPKDILESILASNKNLVHYQMHDPASVGFIFNLTHKPFDNQTFREAIVYALDRSKIREVGNYYGTTETDYSSTGLIPSEVNSYVSPEIQAKMTKYNYDPNKAAQLLQSIGWKKNSSGQWEDPTGKVPNFSIASDGGWVPAVNSGEVVAEQLTQFGLPTTYKAVDSSVYWTQVGQNNHKGDPYDMHFDWTDVTWQFNYPWSPLSNYWWNTFEQTGWNLKPDGTPDFTGTDWNGNSVDPFTLLQQMPFMSSDQDRTNAIDQMAYVANQGAYAVTLFQNVTGTWFNSKTVGGLPWQAGITKYNRDLPIPPTDQQEAIAETNEGFAGETWLIDGNFYPN